MFAEINPYDREAYLISPDLSFIDDLDTVGLCLEFYSHIDYPHYLKVYLSYKSRIVERDIFRSSVDQKNLWVYQKVQYDLKFDQVNNAFYPY